MCLLTLRSTNYKDGTIQQNNLPTSFKDGSQDFNIQQSSSSIEEYKDEKKTETSVTKNPGSILNKLEAPFYFDNFLHNDAAEYEYLRELRAALTPVEDNLKTRGLQYRIKDLKKVQLILEKAIHYISVSACYTIGYFMNNEMDLSGSKKPPPTEEEKKEYIRQMFLMLFIIFLIKNISDNVKYRQTSCRKYPSLNSILCLLWQSGDVEANPGPSNSTMYRKWLYETCSVVRKAIAGVPAECKMSNIWKKKPENWPHGESYFDPRNSKGLTVNKVEDFLQILMRCCDDTSKLSHEFTSEINTWNSHRSKDNDQLLHLYRTRGCLKSTEQVERSLKVLQSHLLPDEILTVDVNTCIRISLSCKPAIHQQLITHTIYRAEATLKISSFLCRILHGKDPERKCDHIWTLLPDGWPSSLRYYNPNNGGERCAENEDGMVVEALITLCEKKSIILSKAYQDMVDAWQADDQTLLSKLLTRHTAETDLKKAVMKLHEERLLQDQEVDKQLRELGLLVQCDGSTQNVKSQKRKIVNTMNKHETKRTKQSDHKDAVDTTLKELLPDCSIDQLLDIQSDSLLLDKISQNIPDFLGDEADDIQFHWNQ